MANRSDRDPPSLHVLSGLRVLWRNEARVSRFHQGLQASACTTAEINKILVAPEAKALAVKLNVEPPQPRSIEQFRTLLVRDLDVWKKIVNDGKITAD